MYCNVRMEAFGSQENVNKTNTYVAAGCQYSHIDEVMAAQFLCGVDKDKSVAMASKTFIILLLILFVVKVDCQSSKEAMKIAETFFNGLIEKYESSVLNNETKASIDQEVEKFVDNTLKYINIPREKKQIPKLDARKTGVEVFDGLKEVERTNTTDTRDLHFFKKHGQFFKVVITSTDLIVYQFFDTQAIPITYHPVPYPSKLQVCKSLGTIWFIVRQSYGFVVLHFYQRDGQFSIQEVQSINVHDVEHFSVWCDQAQMFLGISSTSTFYVYTWLEGSFRLIEFLPVPTSSSTYFVIDETLHLVVLEHRRTTIMRYSPHTQRFVVIQSISKSFKAVTTMQITRDHFLALSSSRNIILYKLSEHSRFVPFQEIPAADQLVSVVKNNTMILISMMNDTLSVHQYDGWRFVKMSYRLGGIESLKLITWRNEEHLVVKKVKGGWVLMRLSWSRAGTPSERIEDLGKWCLAAKNKAKNIPKFMTHKQRVEASNVNLNKIVVDSVNGISANQLKKLNESYTDLLTRLQATKDTFARKRSLLNPHFPSLQTKSVHVSCTDKCHVGNLVTELPFDLTSKLRRIDDESLSLKFEKVHVDTLEGFPCPKIGVKLEEVTVKGLINGVSFDEVYKNALRTSGNQVVTGNHIFEELHVDSLLAPNIEAASTFTRQKFRTKAIYAEELILTDGGLLLPLDGEPVTMTGTLTTKKATFNKLVDQRGGITGKSIKKFSPMIFFSDYHELTGNYTLGNVKISDLLVARDVARESSGKSLKDVVEGAIPLGGDVPVRLQFSRDRTVWSNITVENLPNWLTRKNARMVKVTGKKIALKNITLPDSIYSKLPLPKIEAPVCAIAAFTENLRTSSIQVGRATAKNVVADSIEGAKDLDDLINDCITSLDEVDMSKKEFTGQVFVENLKLDSFEGSALECFDTSSFKWHEPHVLKGPITFKKLNVSLINAAEGIKVPLPSEIQSLVVDGNFQVKTLNGIDLDHFLKNVVRINESIELKNVKFEGSVEARKIITTNSNINLQVTEPNVFLGNKTIKGDLIIEGDLFIPSNDYPAPDEVTTYVVDGSVKFKKEPHVVNINGMNLRGLMDGIWMSDRPTKLTGSFHIENVTLLQPFESYHLLNTPNFGSWSTVQSRLLSKTKPQEIPSTLYFKSAKIPNLITLGNSTINSSDPYLNDLLYMSLKKNVNYTILDKWRFEELIITDDLILDGKINNLNLSTDVARHDVKVNMITGKKTVKELSVKYLHALNFGEFAKDALMQSGMEGRVMIIGKKTFDNLHMQALKLYGTINGKRIENFLTKYGDQVITAPKVIIGSLYARSLVAKGLINGMNFTDVALNQLSKNESLLRIKSDVVFTGNLNVEGNIAVKSLQGVNMQNSNSINENFVPLANAINYLKPHADAIQIVNKNRAKYWYKFEELKAQTLLPVSDHSPSVTLTLHQLGNCILISGSDLECNGHERYYLKPFVNSTTILVNEILSVENVPVVVQVSSGPRSRITIYQYDLSTNTFVVKQSIRVPGITNASVLNHHGVIWIVTLLNSEMLVLRYQTWDDLQQYHLPSSSNFVLDRVPATDEAILVRDDGMWKLDGLAGPRLAFQVELKSEKIETFYHGNEFFVRLTNRSGQSVLLRARYVGV